MVSKQTHLRIDGKIIVKVQNSKATTIGELSEKEKIKVLELERELNDRVALEMYKKYGISIRVHL